MFGRTNVLTGMNSVGATREPEDDPRMPNLPMLVDLLPWESSLTQLNPSPMSRKQSKSHRRYRQKAGAKVVKRQEESTDSWFALLRHSAKNGPFTLDGLLSFCEAMESDATLRVRRGGNGEWASWGEARTKFPELALSHGVKGTEGGVKGPRLDRKQECWYFLEKGCRAKGPVSTESLLDLLASLQRTTIEIRRGKKGGWSSLQEAVSEYPELELGKVPGVMPRPVQELSAANPRDRSSILQKPRRQAVPTRAKRGRSKVSTTRPKWWDLLLAPIDWLRGLRVTLTMEQVRLAMRDSLLDGTPPQAALRTAKLNVLRARKKAQLQHSRRREVRSEERRVRYESSERASRTRESRTEGDEVMDDPVMVFLRGVQVELGEDIVVVSVFDVPSEPLASRFIGDLSFGEHHSEGGWLPPNRMRALVAEGVRAVSIHIAGMLEAAEAAEVVKQATGQGWTTQVDGIGLTSKAIASQVPSAAAATEGRSRQTKTELADLNERLFHQLDAAWVWGKDNAHPLLNQYPQFKAIRDIGVQLGRCVGFSGMQASLASAKNRARRVEIKRSGSAYLGGYTAIAEDAWVGIEGWVC